MAEDNKKKMLASTQKEQKKMSKMHNELKKLIAESVRSSLKENIKLVEAVGKTKEDKAKELRNKAINNPEFGAWVKAKLKNTIPSNIEDKDVAAFIEANPESVRLAAAQLYDMFYVKKTVRDQMNTDRFNKTIANVKDDNDEDENKTEDKPLDTQSKKASGTDADAAASMARNIPLLKKLGFPDPENYNSSRSMIGQIATDATRKFKERLDKLGDMEKHADENPALAKFYEDFEFTLDKAAEFFVKLLDSVEGNTIKLLTSLKKANLVSKSTTEEEIDMLDQLVELVHGDSVSMDTATPEASIEIEQLLKDDLMSDDPTFQSFRNLFAGLFAKVLENIPEDQLDNMLMSIGSSDKTAAVAAISAAKKRGRPPLSQEEKDRREKAKAEEKAARLAAKKQ